MYLLRLPRPFCPSSFAGSGAGSAFWGALPGTMAIDGDVARDRLIISRIGDWAHESISFTSCVSHLS